MDRLEFYRQRVAYYLLCNNYADDAKTRTLMEIVSLLLLVYYQEAEIDDYVETYNRIYLHFGSTLNPKEIIFRFKDVAKTVVNSILEEDKKWL